ncbi:MAG: serine/threonine-protein kinase [Acidimicrobiia bacterium]
MSLLPESRCQALRDALPFLTIGEVLGGGAGGWVLAAFDESSHQRLAVKVLAEGPLRDPRARGRMRTEGEILTTCRHPNLIHGFTFDEFDDMSVLVMERVDGETVLQRSLGSRLPVTDACGIFSATARALHQVHEHGFLHGDVKPENVLFDPAGRHRLIDFGLARRWPFPVQQQVAGTPWYMAPETILAGGALVPATDVYALGMMAYELLAGHLPYPPADGPIGIMRQQLEVTPIPLAAAAPHLPLALIVLVTAAIEKDIEQRIASAEEFADRLEEIDLSAM